MYSTTIVDVRAKTVNRKSDGKEIVIYEIEDGDSRKWSTVLKKLATQANGLIGENVVIDGRIERNGEYVNHFLEGVQRDDQPSIARGIPEDHRIDPRAELGRVEARQLPQPQNGSHGPTEKDWTIWRQTAAKVSANISDTPAEFWHNLDDLLAYFATGQKPNFIPGAPTPHEELNISSTIKGDPGSDIPPYADDDLPF